MAVDQRGRAACVDTVGECAVGRSPLAVNPREAKSRDVARVVKVACATSSEGF